MQRSCSWNKIFLADGTPNAHFSACKIYLWSPDFHPLPPPLLLLHWNSQKQFQEEDIAKKGGRHHPSVYWHVHYWKWSRSISGACIQTYAKWPKKLYHLIFVFCSERLSNKTQTLHLTQKGKRRRNWEVMYSIIGALCQEPIDFIF